VGNLIRSETPLVREGYRLLCADIYEPVRRSTFTGKNGEEIWVSVLGCFEIVNQLSDLFDFEYTFSVPLIENWRGCTQIPANYSLPTSKEVSHLKFAYVSFEYHDDFPVQSGSLELHDWILKKRNSQYLDKKPKSYLDAFKRTKKNQEQ